MKRRSPEELKKEVCLLASRLGKTPSRKEIGSVVKESEYAYYGMTVTDFQAYCGLEPNKSGLDRKVSDEELLGDLAKVCISELRIPHQSLLRRWIRDGKYRNHTLEIRFGGMIKVQEALCSFAKKSGYSHDFFKLPGWKINVDDEQWAENQWVISTCGFVYLLQHGNRKEFKIGKTNNPIRREGTLNTELPEPLQPIHYIKTDDPSGVESYWHRRFAMKRKNGEWFTLSKEDVRAFQRWKKIF